MKFKLAALVFSAFCASQAAAANFDAFYTFGDSTVDSGWWKGALNGQCGGGVPAPCETGKQSFDDKISSAIADGGTGTGVGVGLTMTQDLASKLGVTSVPANLIGGTNYAISGSLSASSGGSPGNLNDNTNLPSTAGQIANYLGAAPGNLADPSALYLISSGGNDVTTAKTISDPTDQSNYLSQQAGLLADAIHTLQIAGAKDIIVNGLQGSNDLSKEFTTDLFAALNSRGVNYVAADIAGLIVDVENNPTAYNFQPGFVDPGVPGSATDSACVAGLGASGWGQFCGLDPSMEHAHLRTPDAETTSFWADDQHLSAAGQLIEANYELSLVNANFATTPLPAALPLCATGLAALGLLGWRRKRAIAA